VIARQKRKVKRRDIRSREIPSRFSNRIKQNTTAEDDAATKSLGPFCHAPRSELRGDIGIEWLPFWF